ncbi:RidA family protein [Rhodococcus jostii]|uniref:Enamine deaminase RidA, house cleaning of reactive enamine intermediates, YjgF/YER057c/UK114 family n=1 Tax=Rhodococcus jostii TaxID=132919 RepID=A0A1H4IUV8_RHOJO|nr:RidA family protein [Rhodococcus jostii]SEB37088.1 Enamine deaminase RidA, house cleaning of reactive enamine intermediates, YjgF/YER057c/UK114 family [Rhodococcus jostii]
MTVHAIEGLGQPVGLYSHAVVVPKNKALLALSGQLSVSSDGDSLHPGDFEAQMVQVFDNLRTVLQAAGADLSDLVKMTTYLTDASLIEPFYQTRARLFADWFPDQVYPGNTLLVISRLVRPEFLIEIEGLAAVTV